MSAKVFTGTRAHASLNAVTAVGAGNSIDLEFSYGKFTMQTKVTGAPTAVSVTLEGSLDGTTWTTLATSSSLTGDQTYSVDKQQRFVRANLGTLTGGTAPTVTALIVAGP